MLSYAVDATTVHLLFSHLLLLLLLVVSFSSFASFRPGTRPVAFPNLLSRPTSQSKAIDAPANGRRRTIPRAMVENSPNCTREATSLDVVNEIIPVDRPCRSFFSRPSNAARRNRARVLAAFLPFLSCIFIFFPAVSD